MNWRDKAALAIANTGGSEPPKLTKVGFVSNVSADPAPFSIVGGAIEPPTNEAVHLDPEGETRRQHVLAMLRERPGVRYAVLTDTEADPEAVLLTLAIRGQATCELRIPRERYDPFLLLSLIERHGGTVH